MGICQQPASSPQKQYSSQQILNQLQSFTSPHQIKKLSKLFRLQIEHLYQIVLAEFCTIQVSQFISETASAINEIRFVLSVYMFNYYRLFCIQNFDDQVVMGYTIQIILECYLAIKQLRSPKFKKSKIWWKNEYFYMKSKALEVLFKVTGGSVMDSVESPIINFINLLKKVITQMFEEKGLEIIFKNELSMEELMNLQMDEFYRDLISHI